MQPYKGYFIAGSALLVHPFSPDWYVGGSVLVPGRGSSIVETGRFQVQRFTVGIKELAEWFGQSLKAGCWLAWILVLVNISQSKSAGMK